MRTRAVTLLAICSLTTIAGAQSRPTISPAETFIAMLKAEAVVVPFAKYSGGRWTNDGAGAFDGEPAQWPKPWFFPQFEPGRTRRLTDWSAMLIDADLVPRSERLRRTRVVHTHNAVAVRASCEMAWGLSTDLAAFTTNVDDAGTTVGIAVTGAHELSGFTSIDKQSALGSKLKSFVEPLFNQGEADALTHLTGPPSRSFPAAAARHALPITLTQIVRTESTIGGRHLYFVRGERIYRGQSSPQRCDDLFGAVNFWIGEDTAGSLQSFSSEVALVAECTEKIALYRSPIATLSLDGRTFVAVVEQGYESRTFAIFEATERAIRRILGTPAGGC